MTTPQYPDDLVTLTTAANEFEAGNLVAVLREAEIEAFAFGAVQGWYPLGGQIAVPVQVRQADLERAQAALKQNVADSVDLDWNEVDVGQVEDDVPISHPHESPHESPPMPVIVRLGFLLALALLAIMVIGALVMLWPRW